HRAHVASQPEEGGMAQRHHAGIAKQQVEAGRRDGEHDDAAREAQVKIRAGGAQHPGQRQGRGECKEGRERAARHRPRTGHKPCGRQARTAAISRYIATDASAGPAALDHCGGKASRKACCKSVRPSVSTTPTSSAPSRAPRMEPTPPITTTTKAGMRMFSPMPTCTASKGPSKQPATAQRAAPRPNTAVNSRGTLTPIAEAI